MSANAAIKAEVAAMTKAILEGADYVRPKPPPVKRAYVERPRNPEYNYSEMGRLRRQGLRVSEIAAATGAHRSTVIVALETLGIYTPDPAGRPAADLCTKGMHLMAEHGRPVKGGGRYCAPCKYAGERARIEKGRKMATNTPTVGDERTRG